MISEWLSQLSEADAYFLMLFTSTSFMFLILISCIGKDQRRLKHIGQELGISQPSSRLDIMQRVFRKPPSELEQPVSTPISD